VIAPTFADASSSPPSSELRAKFLREWIDQSGGIVHRDAAAAAGYSLAVRRTAVRDGTVTRIRRDWLATDLAPDDLRSAAESGGRLACVSAARRRGWWIPEGTDDRVHVAMDPHGPSPAKAVVAHWSARIAPPAGYGLIESVEDSMAHIASCVSPADSLVLWESAMRTESLSLDAVRRVQWPTAAAKSCADAVTGLSDSGLETIAVVKLSRWGIPIRQQIVLAGRPVDLLIGERLVVQIDGFEHHSTSAQRTKDVALDAELVLRGFTVLRFTYAQVVHDWDSVERTIARAIAAGAHRAA
jgi:very-short-patch-repair endonuclease